MIRETIREVEFHPKFKLSWIVHNEQLFSKYTGFFPTKTQ